MSPMRRSFATAMGTWLVVAALPGWGQAPAKSDAPKVVATATATAHVKPDAARVTFNVITTEGSDKSAREANEKAVKRMKDALTGLKLGKTEVEIHALPSAMSMMVSAQQDVTAPLAIQAKRAQTTFLVSVRDKDLDKLRDAVSKIAETASENGGRGQEVDDYRRALRLPRGLGGQADEPEHINGPSIEWLATSSGDARRDAIRRAVKDAMADAEAAAGTNKLKVIEIDVSSGEQTPSAVRSVIGYPFGSDTSTQEGGPIKIKVEVRLTCSY